MTARFEHDARTVAELEDELALARRAALRFRDKLKQLALRYRHCRHGTPDCFCVAEAQGELDALELEAYLRPEPAGADARFALVEREVRAMSPDTRRRLDELLARLGEADRAKDVTPREGR